MFPVKRLAFLSIATGLAVTVLPLVASKTTIQQAVFAKDAPFSFPQQQRQGIINQSRLIAQKQRKIALVIGNAAYERGTLPNTINDATDVAKALRELGFEVTLLQNQDLRTMEAAIDNFSQLLRNSKGRVGVFYYAGHGVQVEGENYLIPLKAKLQNEKDVKYEAYPLGKVLNAMGDGENQVNILIIDACRDNPYSRQWRSSRRGFAPLRGLAKVESPPEGTIIAFSTAPGKQASDGTGRNSPFASYLLQYIKEPNVDVNIMFRKVRKGVLEDTNREQEPWYQESLEGSFSFNPTVETTTPIVTNSPSPKPTPKPSPILSQPSPTPKPSIAFVPKPSPSPSKPPNQPRSTLISSKTGVDYTPLRELLSQKKWKEADQKTWDLMLAAANRQKKGYLDTESVNKFSCEDLRMMDQEWLNASGGKFGFSVQLAIYKQTGNTPGIPPAIEEAYARFADAVGWRKNGSWLRYNNLTWGTNAPAIAPQGHLPVLGSPGGDWDEGMFWIVVREISPLSLRLVNCSI